MRNPYVKILLLSALITVLLFALDKDAYTFTLPSLIGYAVVGLLYTLATAALGSLLFATYRLLVSRIRQIGS